MKRTRTLALLTALVCLCVSLTACSPKEVLKSAILKTTTALGLRQESSSCVSERSFPAFNSIRIPGSRLFKGSI